jgi:hypothetical protein
MREEGFSMRDAGRTLAESLSAVAVTFALVEWIGPLGLLAFPVLAWLFWGSLRREREPVTETSWLPDGPETEWLDDAYASRQRRTEAELAERDQA